MRVLWVFDSLSSHHVELANCLAQKEGMEFEIICRWLDHPPLDRSRVPLTNLTCRSKLDFTARRTLRQRLQAGRYDVVHAYTSRALANVLAALPRRGPQPRVIGYRGTVNQLSLFDPANWITFWHPRLSKIICVAEATNSALQKSGISPHKLVTVWEGSALKTTRALSRAALQQFDIPPNAFVVGLVANMRRVKGVDILLRAAHALSDLTDVYYLLIGDVRDSLVHELAEDDRIRHRVRLPGPREHGGSYAGLFDVYVSPSRMEGMPMSIMEAMIQGICPVTTAVGGCPELVRHQRDGLVVPPENPTALAGAIRSLYQKPTRRHRYAESARIRAAATFSVAAWAERLYGVYTDVAGTPRTRAA